MTKIFCDRCGEEIKKTDTFKVKMRPLYHLVNSDFFKEKKFIDLCGVCMESLQEWMNPTLAVE